MKRSTAALSSLITVATIAGTTTLSAQAHPARMENHVATSHTSTVAVSRLHELLHAPISQHVIRPNDGGSPTH